MKRTLIAAAAVVAGLALPPLAGAQSYAAPRPFPLHPALPSTMPTVSPYANLLDDNSGTALPTVTATPDCGAATPQYGIPAMTSGTCP